MHSSVPRTLTLGDVLAEHRRRHPTKTAVVCQADRYTYPELDERVTRLADALRADGVGPGDRVLWLGQNCHRVLECLLAAGRLGAMFCPANWRQSVDELEFVLRDQEPKVVIWQETEIGKAVRAARARYTNTAKWIQHDTEDIGSYEEYLAGGQAQATFDPVDADTAVLVIYTAAFGGQPNGALITHTNLLTQSLMLAIAHEVSDATIYLVCGPLFHVATWMTTVPTFHFGGTNVFTRRVDAEELCRLIAVERCTRGFIVLPTAQQMAEVNADGRYDLSSFRSALPIPGWRELTIPDTSPWGRTPGGWGQTEVMALVTFAAMGGEPGNIAKGRSSPIALVRVVNESGAEVAPGEVGELMVRGPTVGLGYWNRPELNEARTRGGWWHTTDLGRLDADGTITFLGTAMRMIKSAAENIYPAEVEACLEAHPAVAEAAVIGIADERWTQCVKAIVVLKEGAKVAAEDLIEHCRSSIASYKKPRIVEFVPGPLPRVGQAKDYDALDAGYGGGGYPGQRA